MTNIPQKVADRLTTGIKRFQPILTAAQSREANESDTVIIITDMLSDVFGYDKYTELTSEKSIRGTYCDLATKVDGAIQSLIEAKAVYLELKDNFVRQAVDYASNQGVDWVVLTNGVLWRIYKVTFSKPIDHELILEINFLSLNHHNPADIEQLFLFTKESWSKSALGNYYDQKQALSRFSITAVLLTEPVLNVIRREVRLISPDVKIGIDQIRSVLEQEVLKREVLDGEKADEARKRIGRALKNKLEKNHEEQNVIPTEPNQPPISTPSPNPTASPTSPQA